MGMSDTLRTRGGRGIAAATAVATAAVLALPAAADAWPMHGQNPQNTRQAETVGPDDPGLKWFTDINDLDGFEVDANVDAAGGSENNAAIVSDAGTVIRRAWNTDDGVASLVALDAGDGSLAWSLDGIQQRCGAAIDGQGRLWVQLASGTVEGTTSPTLQAYNPDTGAEIAGTQLVLEDLPLNTYCERSSLHIGGTSEHIVLFPILSEPSLVAIDISGASPSIAWSIDHTDGPPFDALSRDFGQARIGAFTDDAVLIPAITNDQLELVALSLTDGGVADRVDLPVLDADGTDTQDLLRLDTARILIDGSDAVVGVRQASGGRTAAIVGVDLNNFTITWTHRIDARNSTAATGPTQMALSGSNVVYNSDYSLLFGNDVTTGNEASWSGDLDVRELGGSVDFDLITDSAGNVYTAMQPGTGDPYRLIRYSPTGATDWRVPEGALQAETGVAPGPNLRFAAVTSAGELVVYGQNVGTDGHVYVLDNSGGLAEEDQCQLPFTDVPDSSVHAVNICRLVELEITGGTTPTTYSPTNNVTRAQMGTFLARALDLPAGSGDQFPDVDPNSVHAPGILAIREAGITLGRADGTYDPNGTVTRAEMASFLARAAGLEGVDGTGFNDVDPGNVHTPNIYAVRDAEITTGVTATTFNPDGNVRRDQMASFLIRMIDFIDEG